jgi:pantetheine-phosphate adenylyltransferase
MDRLDYVVYHPVFATYGLTEEKIAQVASRWQEKHRYYHTEAHLNFLLTEIEKLYAAGTIDDNGREVLLLTAFFHDAVYDPTSQVNEEESAVLFDQLTQPHKNAPFIRQLILDTKTHVPSGPLSTLFCELDMAVVTRSDFAQLLEWEYAIFKEYQFVDYTVYRQNRIAFLQHCLPLAPQNQANLEKLIAYVQVHKPKIGIYAGSFNPLHNGHLNILEKAERIFDKVIIAQGINPEKETKESELSHSIIRYRQHEKFSGLLTDYVTQKESFADITLVRGLRNGDDLDYEVNQLRFMEDMKSDLKVVFIRCDKQFEHISSSAIRNLEKINKGLGDKYLPPR